MILSTRKIRFNRLDRMDDLEEGRVEAQGVPLGKYTYVSCWTEDDEESRVSIIAKRMEISANNATKIKRRLLDQGLIRETGRGRVAIDVPLLKEYLINKS